MWQKGKSLGGNKVWIVTDKQIRNFHFFLFSVQKFLSWTLMTLLTLLTLPRSTMSAFYSWMISLELLNTQQTDGSCIYIVSPATCCHCSRSKSLISKVRKYLHGHKNSDECESVFQLSHMLEIWTSENKLIINEIRSLLATTFNIATLLEAVYSRSSFIITKEL